MQKYSARDIMVMSPEQLWALPDTKHMLIFDDGDAITTTARRTIFSAYLWEFHRLYPQTKLLSKHHIQDARLGSRTHLDILGNCMWDAYDAYDSNLDIAELTRIAYEVTNRLYNDFTYNLEAYVSSVSILDFIEVMDHPEIKKANDSVKPTESSINQTYDIIETVLKDPKALVRNPIADAAKSGLVSMGQVLQCVGPRGYVTDIDSTIFRRPIMVGYVEGFSKLYDSLIESRSAAKATSFSRDHVSDAEYFNRKMQLLAETFRRVHGVAEVADGMLMNISKDPSKKDCGSKAYRSIRLRSSDLRMLAGKYHLTTEGELRPIRESDRHLVGKMVKVRSVFDCRLDDREGVCATCFGELASSIPGITNVGHLCATQLCEMVSQSVLSTKHLDHSSTVDELPLTDYERNYLRLGADPNHIGLAASLKGKDIHLVISSSEAENLSDIQHTEDVRELSLARISELTDIVLIFNKGKKNEDRVPLPVSIGSRKSSMNHKLLEYIKLRGWSLTGEGDYVIDLKDWSQEDTLFELALRHINMLDFMDSIEHMVKSTGRNSKMKTLRDFDDPWTALLDLYELVSSKLSVNVVHLELIILSTMIVSSEEYNYNIPLPGEPFEFGAYEQIMSMRSIVPRLAYKRQEPDLYNPRSYIFTNRPSHLLDTIFSE